jgi:hypothetical protein
MVLSSFKGDFHMFLKKFIAALALILAFPVGLAIAGGNEIAYMKIQELPTLAVSSIASGDFIPLFDASQGKTVKLDATKFSTTVSSNLLGRATIWICGDATTVNNNTVYYGPSRTPVSNGGRTCDKTAAGSATEATADEPAFDATAFQVLSWYCLQPDAGADLTYTLRSAAAAMTPAQAITIADNGLDGVNKVGTTTAVASGATLAVAVSSTSDVGTAQWACAINVAF